MGIIHKDYNPHNTGSQRLQENNNLFHVFKSSYLIGVFHELSLTDHEIIFKKYFISTKLLIIETHVPQVTPSMRP